MHVAIAGGGIAGLTSAIALAARGFEVDVYERATVLEEIGAGLQLSPNAMAVLERLGVTGELAGRVSEPDALVIRNAESSALLARMPLGMTARKRYGAPYCTLHRADLQSALLAAASRRENVALNLGSEVEVASATEGSVAFKIDGQSHRSDVLIAADGVGSKIRTGYFRHAGPESLGRSAWRATMPARDINTGIGLDIVGLWLGPGAHLVHYPINAGAALNIVVISAGETERPPVAAFGRVARTLIDGIAFWQRQPLLSVDGSRSWTRGRVVLIGDAAHAMAPSAAQGGAQAIEDAWVLAATLANARKHGNREGQLAAYARLRQPRVERIARMALRNLNIYEAKGISALARDFLLRALPARLMLSQLDWLFGWKPE